MCLRSVTSTEPLRDGRYTVPSGILIPSVAPGGKAKRAILVDCDCGWRGVRYSPCPLRIRWRPGWRIRNVRNVGYIGEVGNGIFASTRWTVSAVLTDFVVLVRMPFPLPLVTATCDHSGVRSYAV